MEDLQRPLPEGWVRQFDANENHSFYVHTTVDPPKSYWEHPLDVPEVVKSLSSEERERLQEEESRLKKEIPHSAEHSEDESHFPALPPRPNNAQGPTKKSLGEKLKDKVTGKTHDERVRDRAKREQEERQYYEAHMKLRQAMRQAEITGQPQFFAKDKDGKDIYIEPPQGAGYGYGGYGSGGYGVNPYQSAPYGGPNGRYIRPGYPYNRPYGGGYGGGFGLPIAGGLLGGLLLGGVLF